MTDPARVPQKTLYTGARMPALGLGTFGSDRYGSEIVSAAVAGAIEAGYRLIDCAACYGNEDRVGEVFESAFANGMKRDELFVISKLWNDRHAPADVAASCRKSLRDLKLDELDAYLVHWPFPNYHAPFCDGDARNPLSRPYIHEEFMETWQAMEKLHDEGLVRHIGISNVTVPKLRLILRDARIKPAINEMELHPGFRQEELVRMSLENGIQPVGYCPLGSPGRPERDRTPDDVDDMELPAVVEAARAHGVHPALICLKWAVQNGQVPIPFSVKKPQYESNLQCVTEDPLTDGEMARINAEKVSDRKIKGQVFLWPGAKDWHALWDEDGNIAGWNE